MTTYRIAKMAQKYMERDMIGKHMELPPYPEVRTQLLYSFLDEHNKRDQQLLALAVSLAQLGLDTHDFVEASDDGETLGQARSRQMKVLAGDYFNGLFYQLLSGADRIDVVRFVTKAICEVNHLKMSLYEKLGQLKLTAEEYLEQMVAIKSKLFLSFSTFIPASYADRFPELLRSVTRCEVLSQELERSHSGDIRHGFAYLYMLQSASLDDREKALHTDKAGLKALLHKYKIYGAISDMLQTQLGLIKQFIAPFESVWLKAEISRMLEPFVLTITVPKVAEEI